MRSGAWSSAGRALATGMGADPSALIDDVHRRTAELASRLRDASPPTVSVLSPGLDGQSLYLLGAGTPAGTVVEALGLPRLGAVRSGRVVEVDVMRWATMSCPLGALWLLDDLAAVLLGEGVVVEGAASPAGLERLRGYRARYARP